MSFGDQKQLTPIFHGGLEMTKQKAAWIMVFTLFVLAPAASPKDKTKPSKTVPQASTSPNADTQNKNLQKYVELMRADVGQQKTDLMGAVMQLSAADAAKFWPIYSEYNTELTKLNDLRVANIQEYARTYPQMTDAKANELIQNSFKYQKLRSDLLSKYYDRVKQSLGATTAARFVQVENQLLLIIDLKIASSLPIVGLGS
jgi:hypothetical protein